MATDPKALKIKDFIYPLPEDRIAKFPLADRAASKLLFYQKGNIQDKSFTALPDLLPPDALLVFNNTKVVQARLFFKRPSGATIEIFCLEPVAPVTDMQLAMQQTGACTWKCLVGNAKRWKEESLELEITLPEQSTGRLKVTKCEKLEDSYFIHFTWEPVGLTFADILATAGNLPLPPYLNRLATEQDKQTYQTVYARQEGAVAAPTAGLHFTQEIFEALAARQIKTLQVTLHVGAGTFKPVKAEEMAQHNMHGEEIFVSAAAINQIRNHLPRPVIPVGTTSLRTLESLYWLGVMLIQEPELSLPDLCVPQWLPYETLNIPEPAEALSALTDYLQKNQLEYLSANTQIIIAPGYSFKLVRGLVTNFHQPESTLLLLVSALIGEDWRRIYDHGLANNYRFLSYGDSSLLLP
ncbi:S-adenosylmethionine:tRNA ribosyltransferase-isomerase [Adhaeribacter aerolatus]|uniref:S-adenosylmethionine:tRNA ribosyltransferase-isomerase n=1 Tax=Adhaeribacter aerolatus TaxID=670289 RepID=A0A512AUS6_9BACT|nr:S-adenosylmethionine:tRNA ribosyltransferase-isomerase [Adhaeribacter aerolatus]GEO03476.1 S-adenosylmethionine:tRNA ribosyltransferase-isomerase [Adhaeribacter aerolatus]